jgi:hypothetical protein
VKAEIPEKAVQALWDFLPVDAAVTLEEAAEALQAAYPILIEPHLAKVKLLEAKLQHAYGLEKYWSARAEEFAIQRDHAEQLLAEARTEFDRMADQIDQKAAELSDYDLGRMAAYTRASQFLAVGEEK